MRTKTTKVAEVMAFEKLSTLSILIGVSKVLSKRAAILYKKHEMPIVYVAATLGWALSFSLMLSR